MCLSVAETLVGGFANGPKLRALQFAWSTRLPGPEVTGFKQLAPSVDEPMALFLAL